MKNRIFVFLLVFFFVSGTKIHSQITFTQIDSLVNRAMDKFAVAGVAVAVVKNGKVIHEKGYGLRNIHSKDKVNQFTNFGIASNSKAFTTAALAMLVEEGKLSWQDKVVDIIPEFKMYDDYTTMHFNIEDLLTHRSGLGLGMGDLMFFPDGADFSMKDIVKNFQYFKPVSAFRTKFDYDNLLYLVAGEVIKRKSGMPWEEFVKKRIFEPLGMKNSYASLTYIPETSNLALPHLNKGKKISLTEAERWDPEKINGAAGGIYSNVHDLSKWMLMQLNHGKHGNKQLFGEENHQKMWRIHTVLPAGNPRYNTHFAGYGLGWFLSDVKGKMMVSHTGGLMGMLSKTLLIPDLNLGIVVLTNTYPDGGAVFSAISQSILDKYLGMDSMDWVAYYGERTQEKDDYARKVVDKVWKKVNKNRKNTPPLNKFKGVYKDPWFGKIFIEKKENQLWFRSARSPKLSGPMYFYGDNTFVVKWPDKSLMDADAFVIFQLDENGKATGFKMKGISPAIDFSYDFQDLFPVKISEE